MAITKVTSGLISADASSIDLNIDAGTLYLDVSENRVGIGTTSPSTQLHLNATTGSVVRLARQDGSVVANDSLGKIEFYTNDVTNTGVAGYIDVQAEGGAAGGSMIFGTGTAGSASEQVRIAASGNVGIGTNNPTRQLMVQDSSANCFVSVVTGTGNVAGLMLGDTDDETQGRVNYDNSTSSMLFYTADTEKVRIDSSGNVGIGHTDANVKLDVNGAIRTRNSSSAILYLSNLSTQYAIQNNGNDLTIGRDGTERMRIDSSGVISHSAAASSSGVICRTTAPSGSQGLNISAGVITSLPSTTPSFADNSSSGGTIFLGGNAADQYGGNVSLIAYGSGASGNLITFANRSGSGTTAEKMRIDSSGRLLLGRTTDFSSTGYKFQVDFSNTTTGILVASDNTASKTALDMRDKNNSGSAGTITYDGLSAQYNTSSDYRLKENIQPLENGLKRLNNLKPIKFNWKEDGKSSEGFIAHEVQEIFSDAVSGEKDGEEMQGMDYGRITPLLVKAIQEQQTIIDDLKTRIETLENA